MGKFPLMHAFFTTSIRHDGQDSHTTRIMKRHHWVRKSVTVYSPSAIFSVSHVLTDNADDYSCLIACVFNISTTVL